MFKWLLAILLRRTYFTAVTEPTEGDYGCIMHGYRDRHGRVKVTKVKYIEPEGMGKNERSM